MRCSDVNSQLLALKWIKDNIESFGGDQNNITLAGQSAGAVSAHFMMLSDLTEGLFHKAILQSGSCLGWWAYKQGPDSNIFFLLEFWLEKQPEIPFLFSDMLTPSTCEHFRSEKGKFK